MHQRQRIMVALAIAVLSGVMSVEAGAQTVSRQNPVQFGLRNMGGPRLGITYVYGNGPLYQYLMENNMDRVISQFGWHFEHQVVPEGGGPQFVIQVVPLFGGVEYGKIAPVVALAMGVRFPKGIEFGLGPELIIAEHGLKSALVMGIGKTFDYSGVSIPVNLVFTRNNDGGRFSILFGYAIQKTGQR